MVVHPPIRYTMRRALVIVLTTVALALAAFAIFWLAGHNFGMLQAVEFFPYDDTVALATGAQIRASGVVVRINQRDAMPSDKDIALLMVVTQETYPKECSGDNWEISVRRPVQGGVEERYSFYHSIYETDQPGSWIEYGRWTDQQYTVLDSYPAVWDEVTRIAHGAQSGFRIEVGNPA